MLVLTKYADLIRELVAKENEKDQNWKWSVKSIGKTVVRIRWGYLDYLEEKENCFRVVVSDDSYDGSSFITARTPDGQMIEGFIVAETPNPKIGCEQTIESGIRDAVSHIAYCAHSRY